MIVTVNALRELQSATGEELRPLFGRTLLSHEVPIAQRSGRMGAFK